MNVVEEADLGGLFDGPVSKRPERPTVKAVKAPAPLIPLTMRVRDVLAKDITAHNFSRQVKASERLVAELINPEIAAAYEAGFESGQVAASECCGCSGTTLDPIEVGSWVGSR